MQLDKTHLIFEDFQPAGDAMNRPYEGTGLGLSIAKTLVEMMAVNISVEHPSDPGSRFLFTVFFGKTTEEALAGSCAARAATKVGSQVEAGTRVLVAEDNPENVILLRAYRENVPLLLHLASNGAEAVEIRERSNFDLILMDIQMPIIDGHTAIREIRAWE